MSMKRLSIHLLCTLLLATLAVSAYQLPAWSQDAEEPAAAEPATPRQRQARSEARGRLPNFYTRVVTPQQREQIYEIQQGYAEEIEALEAKLMAVREKMTKEIEGVLDAEQLAEVKKLEEEAQQRRQRGRGAAREST